MWAGCESPKAYLDLPVGNHQFKVSAIDVANQEEPSPSVFDWQIVEATTTEPIIEIPVQTSTSAATSTTP